MEVGHAHLSPPYLLIETHDSRDTRVVVVVLQAYNNIRDEILPHCVDAKAHLRFDMECFLFARKSCVFGRRLGVSQQQTHTHQKSPPIFEKNKIRSSSFVEKLSLQKYRQDIDAKI
jgi:hypothetical protein